MLTLVGLVLVGLVVLALVLVGRGPADGPTALETGGEPVAAGAREPGPPGTTGRDPLAPLPGTPAPDAAGPTAAAAAPGSPAARADRFDGRGVLRGDVRAGTGAALPERFTVVAEPSRWLVGKERAVTRRVEVAGGRTSFRIEDLPYGGYDVRAEAPGMNGPAQGVLLQRGSASPHVTLELRPAGFLDGGVLRADGSPAEGLEVTLEASDGARRTTTTDAAGNFVFRAVLDGEYRLFLGPPVKPLLPARELSFRAPSMRFPTQTLPETIDLSVQALDPSGRPLANVLVRGYGEAGGSFEERTDADGFVRVRYVPPGRIRIAARSADGLQARATTEAPPGGVHQVRLRLR